MSITNDLNFGNGEVLFNDLNKIFLNIPLNKQVNNLKEDLLQVSFPKKLLLDVGWYPSFDKNGNFVLQIIENYNWEGPKLLEKTDDLEELKKILHEFVVYCSA